MSLQARSRVDFTAQIYRSLMNQASSVDEKIDGMAMMQHLAGILIETLLLFDDPDDGLEATYQDLAAMLDCEPSPGPLGEYALPPSYIIDYETERGRALAKGLFEEWLTCAYEFHDLLLFVLHHVFVQMEQAGQPRQDVFRIFIECANRCMGYEIAAQELCDIVIDCKIGRHGWSLPESVTGLGALSGRSLALTDNNDTDSFYTPSLPQKLDQVAYVMTQEAVRLGIPAGSDWRFGLAANDCIVTAPYSLIEGLEPHCREFFIVIQMYDLMDQAVASAKAAGRMLAVAAGGDVPEMDPVIAKPLAMAAMADTYKTICRDVAIISC